MSTDLKPGWLQRQFDNVDRDMATWPEWMRREAVMSESTITTEQGRTCPQCKIQELNARGVVCALCAFGNYIKQKGNRTMNEPKLTPEQMSRPLMSLRNALASYVYGDLEMTDFLVPYWAVAPPEDVFPGHEVTDELALSIKIILKALPLGVLDEGDLKIKLAKLLPCWSMDFMPVGVVTGTRQSANTVSAIEVNFNSATSPE